MSNIIKVGNFYVNKFSGTKFSIVSIDEFKEEAYCKVFGGYTDHPVGLPINYLEEKIKNGSISGLQPMRCAIK